MPATLRICWREGVKAEPDSDKRWIVRGPDRRLVLRPPAPAVADALGRLAPPGEDEDRLVGSILDAGGAEALAAWYFILQQCAGRGLVGWAVELDGRRLATLVPTGPSLTITAPTTAERPLRLSRFAYLHRDDDRLILESARAHARVVLDDDLAAGLVVRLARPTTARDLATGGSGLSHEAVGKLLALLRIAGMVREVADEGTEADDASPSAGAWEFHDLLFHARSRRGRTDAPFGATYRLAHRMEPPSALRPLPPGEAIALERPDLAALEREEPPLARILEHRRSVRDYGPRPITARQLGAFLYRVARVTARRELEAETPAGLLRVPLALRPYPSGGALYELEFHVAANACAGLAPGLYAYDPEGHRLVRRRGRTTDVDHLLRDAALSAGIPAEQVQVLVILASRVPRLAWKYASIAYALTLKHVGVVYQTMYLVATAMGLAPCALGGGDSDLFALASGLDYETETSVGEFLIGSAPPDPERGP